MASMTQPDFMAVPDAVDTAGSIVWWRLSGGSDAVGLEQALIGAGVDPSDAPKRPTPREALARAMRQHQEQRLLARPLGRNKGWALVDETPVEGGLDYRVVCTADVNDLGGPEVSGPPDKIASIRQAHAEHWQRLSSNDVSGWLTRYLVPAVQAVRLRESGGIYFVPQPHLQRFRQIAGALCSATDHVVYQVPALRSDEAVEAILAAVLLEADGEIDGMAGELDAGELGKRALRTREGRCDALRLKVEAYEQLLGRSMEALRERLGGLRGSIVEAAFLAEEPEEA